MITGVDIVAEQWIARGRRSAVAERSHLTDLHQCGLMLRITYSNFAPSTGRITHSLLPTGQGGVRSYPGSVSFYDPDRQTDRLG
jgi:biotin carboxylase